MGYEPNRVMVRVRKSSCSLTTDASIDQMSNQSDRDMLLPCPEKTQFLVVDKYCQIGSYRETLTPSAHGFSKGSDCHGRGTAGPQLPPAKVCIAQSAVFRTHKMQIQHNGTFTGTGMTAKPSRAAQHQATSEGGNRCAACSACTR